MARSGRLEDGAVPQGEPNQSSIVNTSSSITGCAETPPTGTKRPTGKAYSRRERSKPEPFSEPSGLHPKTLTPTPLSSPPVTDPSVLTPFHPSSPSSFFEAEPECFLQGHEGPVYDVKFYGDGEDALLLSCGDDGRIRGWRWKDCTESDVPVPLQGKHMRPVLDLMNPQHKGPWGALSPIPENNSIAVNTLGGSIYAAAGDSCAYCWDVESGQVKMVFKGHSDYLHSVIARNSTNQIITGSEDGTVRIWGKNLTLLISQACGSGRSLSVWNLPASECISKISTPAAVQDVVFDGNQILAVGAEPLLYRFNINGEILSQIQCAPQSAFSVSLHPSGVTAVGGYGALVDVISQFGSHLCTFRCQFEY
ncbi:WD repeat containing protein [Trema orientale]|uniref:WD repeat containing protein n=1 Tax=Trema orientale TaxID=63057 RepID=A0A2P5EFW8_TREOI|nr:WD repeat containing protein [Trema orientale]